MAKAALKSRVMEQDSKIAVVIREDLLTWQKLNVTAFLVSGIATACPDLLGVPYEDGSGAFYLPMFAIPVVVLAADRPGLRRAFDRASSRRLMISLYTEELFATGNDADNRAAVKKVATADLALVGIAIAGDCRSVDKALDRMARVTGVRSAISASRSRCSVGRSRGRVIVRTIAARPSLSS